ncbi:MAG: hypothetical protein LV479_00535 [Methylacidiphilales bacterium]|nr:hypothetical protein [Candidatus Methylacidiphilales bacterium]
MEHTFSGSVLYDGMKPGHAFLPALVAGLITAMVGAALWVGVTVLTGMRVPYVALAVGAFVGFTVRATGNGSTPIFGLLGAALTFLGCIGGEFFAEIQSQTTARQDFFYVLWHANISELGNAVISTTTPTACAIYAVGMIMGYFFSLRKLS